MPNLTLFIDPDRIERAKKIAAARKSSLSALLRQQIDEIVDDEGQARPPSLGQVITVLRENQTLLAKQGLIHASIFGSVARGQERPGSDVDIAVVLETGKDLLDLAGIAASLEALLGCRVDLASRTRLSGDAAAGAVDAF